MTWLQRWNFIERARLERQLWDAFERGEDLEALVEECRASLEAGDRGQAFRLEVWTITLQRIRRIERLMADQQDPGVGSDGQSPPPTDRNP
jgi:hypothetical protein